jgi:hypothetical protein
VAEIRTVTTLRYKRDEIETAIVNYEKRLAQAKADLTHINAAIAIFEASGDAKSVQAYFDLHRLFKYGEISALCKAALANGPLSTRDIATYVIEAKGLDLNDKVLAKAIGMRLIHSLRRQRKTIVSIGRHKAAHIWRLQD